MSPLLNVGWACETGFWQVECDLLSGLARKHLAGCPHQSASSAAVEGTCLRWQHRRREGAGFQSHLLGTSFPEHPARTQLLQEQRLSLDSVKTPRFGGCSSAASVFYPDEYTLLW